MVNESDDNIEDGEDWLDEPLMDEPSAEDFEALLTLNPVMLAGKAKDYQDHASVSGPNRGTFAIAAAVYSLAAVVAMKIGDEE